MVEPHVISAVSVSYSKTGRTTANNYLGMRPMQERAYEKRGEQYLLIKSPPASGKSRALMFIALDKLYNQDLKQAIVVVPEKAIGASFENINLSELGFWKDWLIVPRWNLCNAVESDDGKVKSLKKFLESGDKILVCTHATFRYAVEKFGVEVFDKRVIAIDEFHHVSSNFDNVLGSQVARLMDRNLVNIVAMTGSYFRGDAEPVLRPEYEERFETVTFDYCEQLDGYTYLEKLDIGYFFYSGSYVDSIMKVLDTKEKTIIHIPSVNSRESTKDKCREVEDIMSEIGTWEGTDPETGFQELRTSDGRVLRVADLVDDAPARRDRVSMALKDPSQRDNRDHVDIIIALGMAKEGFDWIWCEHALTVGYRASLTEVVQIIGRTTRDAIGKTRAKFTNLIAEPDASEEAVAEAVNDTLKAIAASLLMEQVLTPRFDFVAKKQNSCPVDGFDYGDEGYDPECCNVGVNIEDGSYSIEVNGLFEPQSDEAKEACNNDINEIIVKFMQDRRNIERGVFDDDTIPEDLTQVGMGKVVRSSYPDFSEEDQEAIRQRAVLEFNLKQRVSIKKGEDNKKIENTKFIRDVRRYVMDVRDLNIDLIDRINPFDRAYAVLSKTMNKDILSQVASVIAAKRVKLTLEEARELAKRALRFYREHGRKPLITSPNPWEKRMAEGVAYMARML